jgi:hypothetical protein
VNWLISGTRTSIIVLLNKPVFGTS